MAHVGHELRLVLAGDFEFTALLGDVVEQPNILYRNNGLIGKRLDEFNLPGVERSNLFAIDDDNAK